jgi:predicted secreted hydrolase
MKLHALRTWWSGAGVALALAVLALGGCGVPGTIASTERLRPAAAAPTATPLPPVQFPLDEAPHHDLTEWWYYTGHFHGTDAAGHTRTYGFELVVFQTLRGTFPAYYAAHFAITDLARGEFHYDQRVQFGGAGNLPTTPSSSGFNLEVGGWGMQGVGGQDHLTATMAGYTIDLRLAGVKPAVLHGGTGLITYGLAGFSYYYSRPRMAVSGTLLDHSAAIAVSGIAWMDHQWGNFVSLAGSGWDWYSIQLDNNTEYMLYIIRDEQKRPLSVVGTYVSPDGRASEVNAAAIGITARGMWVSPVTQGQYPAGWQLTLSDQRLTLTLSPALADQELVTAQSTGVAYWEGAVRVSGTIGGSPIGGQGYVELTGYASVPNATPTLP